MSDDVEAVANALLARLLDLVKVGGPIDTDPIRGDLRTAVLRAYAARPPTPKTTTEKGLGWDHQQVAKELKRTHIEGTICWWCGEPMYLSQGLAADHSKARAKGGTKADRLLHGPCNSARGKGERDHTRPALKGKVLGNRMAW
ncbi:hypothetical protein [Rhodococcoides fascians]|uniref:hypothetical protein n=1 Tax=Rhodococcoides fascians TaxID=1828 RepID=UPI0027873F8B|nr:hypothetical protein [Rhodococcus fascians]MDQ0283773.1 hypothetical protein [Rhodococcus fascians]